MFRRDNSPDYLYCDDSAKTLRHHIQDCPTHIATRIAVFGYHNLLLKTIVDNGILVAAGTAQAAGGAGGEVR